jgi:molybdopterin molybdotransferase
MISFEQAYQTAMDAVRTMPPEKVALPDALNRILAEEVTADIPMPPYDKAMVDGFACKREDLSGSLKVLETIGAGYEPTRAIVQRTASKIMTGAMLPEGADCVFMVEHSQMTDEDEVRFTGERTNDNIAPKASDIQAEDSLLQPGHRILPADIAVLASMGNAEVSVSQRPRIGVIATGDELVEPNVKPGASQIRNSNGYQVCAQVNAMGCVGEYRGIGRDNLESLGEIVGSAVEECDVVLISGGVSMGEFDFVPDIFKKYGIEIQFDRVAIQPGKPSTFAFNDSVFCFGLPGNPVSGYTIFELMVKPFIFAMMGHTFVPLCVRMPLGMDFKRKSGARPAWVPVVASAEGTINRIEYHGSAHINALSHAHGLLLFPEGETELKSGTLMDMRLTN